MQARNIVLADKNRCTGCSACASVCPKQSIKMMPDEEGFLFPVIDKNVCVGCGKCEMTCPVLRYRAPTEVQSVYAARSQDEEILKESTSGGVFTILAQYVISLGGVVFGVAFDYRSGCVEFIEVREFRLLGRLRGSKYVQADVGPILPSVRRALESNAKAPVLFCGTPCQVAGLKAYLARVYSNLIAVDFVCHGAPSPMAWKHYIDGLDVKREGFRLIKFRDKSKGWRKYAMSIVNARGRQLCSHWRGYPFLWGFLSDLFNRRSCHACSFRGYNASDLTIGDFWGIQNVDARFDDEKGVSLVIIRSDHGVDVWRSVENRLDWVAADYKEVCAGNPSLVRNVQMHSNRDVFFRLLNKGLPFVQAVKCALDMGFVGRIQKKLRNLFRKSR